MQWQQKAQALVAAQPVRYIFDVYIWETGWVVHNKIS